MNASPSHKIALRLDEIENRIVGALKRAERSRDSLRVIAVTKTHPASVIEEAFRCGLRHFGENRVQEFAEKKVAFDLPDATFHLVGHLQSNKARRAVELFDRVDSVDSAGLAQRLGQYAAESGAALPILLQVNAGGEATKGGVVPESAAEVAGEIAEVKGVALEGLMCIPPYSDDPQAVRPYFRSMNQLLDALNAAGLFQCDPPVLSMGMSHDFEIAIEEGATEIRLGTAIFGERPA